MHSKKLSNEIKNKSEEQKEAMSVNLNNEQKQEFASLFSNILKNMIQNETNPKKDARTPQREEKEMDENIENMRSTTIKLKNSTKRATKRLLPINSKRDEAEIEQRRQYLEPLDKLRLCRR